MADRRESIVPNEPDSDLELSSVFFTDLIHVQDSLVVHIEHQI